MGLIFDSKQQFIMYYHTAIRNVGLYTSVALAGIGGARAFLEHQRDSINIMQWLSIFYL